MIIFDDEGMSWSGTRLLKAALGSSIGGFALVQYTVVNIGFVAAREDGASIHIRVRPSVASPTAFIGLLFWLHERYVERVLISYYEEDWSHVLMGSVREAVAFLAGIRQGQRPVHGRM